MQYLISFLEGIITFISPCLLPMLPIYVAYFTGGELRDTRKTLVNSVCFVAGFTIIFVLLGVMAGSLGSFLNDYQTAVNLVSGIVVIFFGFMYMDVIKVNLFRGRKNDFDKSHLGPFSALMFGMIFSIGWTPCVGAFLGSALMLASQQGHILEGGIMLFVYSLGLGIPFILSAILIEKFKSAFDFIKSHYRTINTVCGLLLVIIGILMATGTMSKFIHLLS